MARRLTLVMAGLVPAIHVFLSRKQGVDARDEPANDRVAGPF
jgi:hypothetical protein